MGPHRAVSATGRGMRDKSQPMMPQEGAHELGEDRDTHVTMAENAGIDRTCCSSHGPISVKATPTPTAIQVRNQGVILATVHQPMRSVIRFGLQSVLSSLHPLRLVWFSPLLFWTVTLGSSPPLHSPSAPGVTAIRDRSVHASPSYPTAGFPCCLGRRAQSPSMALKAFTTGSNFFSSLISQSCPALSNTAATCHV